MAATGRPNFAFNPNTAPTEDALIIRSDETGGRALALARFGLAPSWAKDTKIGASLLNARSETVAGKPAFRSAYKARRCVVPVAGFYEWRTEKGRKMPFLIEREDGEPLAIAGLWETARIQGEAITSFTMLTTAPNDFIAPYHDRLLVLLQPDKIAEWLDLKNDGTGLFTSVDTSGLRVRAMNPAMNKPGIKDMALIEF